MCSALQSQFRILAWAGLPLMNDLVRANTECCVLLRPLATKPLLAELIKNKEDFSLPLVYADGRTIKGFEFRNNERRIGEQIFDVMDFRSQWRQACDALKLGIFNKETRSYRGMKPHDFRRTACRNMIANGIPESVAMAISGHKTNSIFKRYAITDKRMVQDAFEQMRKKK